MLVVYICVLHVFTAMLLYNLAVWFVVDFGIGIDGDEIENTLMPPTTQGVLVPLEPPPGVLVPPTCLSIL